MDTKTLLVLLGIGVAVFFGIQSMKKKEEAEKESTPPPAAPPTTPPLPPGDRAPTEGEQAAGIIEASGDAISDIYSAIAG